MQAEGGEGYQLEAGANTWGAADSIAIAYNGEEIERLASGETEIIASSESGTHDPLPKGAVVVAYAIHGDDRTELLRWEVKSGGTSNTR